ncbi:hypothetical protein [Actinokineospora sp. NBRC 105648]|uniref:hypothetical protein n=1 Tax=Actinokineospora sp. NBRC 105648 TaxID=3032206 RepID=UPI00255316EF|nr:hypothetical protein [Actinokineospora sp. NBRC 105648]
MTGNDDRAVLRRGRTRVDRARAAEHPVGAELIHPSKRLAAAKAATTCPPTPNRRPSRMDRSGR